MTMATPALYSLLIEHHSAMTMATPALYSLLIEHNIRAYKTVKWDIQQRL